MCFSPSVSEEEMLGDGYAAAERIALEPNGNPNYLPRPERNLKVWNQHDAENVSISHKIPCLIINRRYFFNVSIFCEDKELFFLWEALAWELRIDPNNANFFHMMFFLWAILCKDFVQLCQRLCLPLPIGTDPLGGKSETQKARLAAFDWHSTDV